MMTVRQLTLGMAGRIGRPDGAVTAILVILATLAAAIPDQAATSLVFTGEALLSIAPYILFSVVLASGAKATGLDRQIGRVFAGRPHTAILLAAAFGAMVPFCSCGVIPLIAGLLAAGVPLGPVMAFWISSPLMSPENFLLTTGVIGVDFALARAATAVTLGLVAGFGTHLLVVRGLLPVALKDIAGPGCRTSSCSAKRRVPGADEQVVWRFWQEPERRATFVREGRGTALFLGKWLTLAFLLESLMIVWLPADRVAAMLGGDSAFAVPLAVAAGIPAYLNGYAAVPAIGALIDMGMDRGAALAFLTAGAVTSIPAALGVYALVRAPVFAVYLGFGAVGALLAGLTYQLSA